MSFMLCRLIRIIVTPIDMLNILQLQWNKFVFLSRSSVISQFPLHFLLKHFFLFLFFTMQCMIYITFFFNFIGIYVFLIDHQNVHHLSPVITNWRTAKFKLFLLKLFLLKMKSIKKKKSIFLKYCYVYVIYKPLI